MTIPHFKKVDTTKIIAKFTDDKLHRSKLTIPFIERTNNNILCIIGQNPSDANEHHADQTLRYLEQFVFQNLTEYSKIIMLNLYSRVDTSKEELTDLERSETNKVLLKTIKDNSDFLLVFGASKKDGMYNFFNKFKLLKPLLGGKNLFKIDLTSNTN